MFDESTDELLELWELLEEDKEDESKEPSR